MIQFSKWELHTVIQANYSDFRTGFIHPDRVMDMHDIIYMVQGEWEIWLEETGYLLTQDHVLILPAGRHHYGKIPCREGTKTIYLHLSDAPGDGTDAPEKNIQLPELIDCRNDKSIYGMFQEITALFWSQKREKDLELASKIKLLFCALAGTGEPPLQKSHRMTTLLKMIQEHPERFFTLEELAGAVHLSTRTVADEFKKVTGRTVHQYQLDLKLQMACSEIKAYPNRSFREIAAAYGFYDEFHFSKSFKQKFGIPPKFARKEAIQTKI